MELRVIDGISRISKEIRGWEALSQLVSEGSYEHIKHRLQTAVEQYRKAGAISDRAYRQAIGSVIPDVFRPVDPERTTSAERSRNPVPHSLLKSGQTEIEHRQGSLRFWQEEKTEYTIKHAAGPLPPSGLSSKGGKRESLLPGSAASDNPQRYLIAPEFGGSELPENLSFQNFSLIRAEGNYSQLERHWAKQLRPGVGVSVHVQDVTLTGENPPSKRTAVWLEVYPDGRLEHDSLEFLSTTRPRDPAFVGKNSRSGSRPSVTDIAEYLGNRKDNPSGGSTAERTAREDVPTGITSREAHSPEEKSPLPRRKKRSQSTEYER